MVGSMSSAAIQQAVSTLMEPLPPPPQEQRSPRKCLLSYPANFCIVHLPTLLTQVSPKSDIRAAGPLAAGIMLGPGGEVFKCRGTLAAGGTEQRRAV